MRLDRRTFLQQAVLALVSVGASETGINLLSKNPRFASWLKPYVETLAQTTDRKLALLVGINDYSQKSRLQGCINDVELQKNLLIHRFGFLPQNIHTLTDRQATRENIESAFTEYLCEQATKDDVVLFHFSGYGSQVKLSNDKLANSLVPIDASIPNKGKPAANDLLFDTLTYLGRSLKTENLITVLDTSFQNTKEVLQGNFRLRSYNEVAQRPSPEEIAFQSQVQRNLPPKKVSKVFNPGATSGILLSAAEQNQIALEGIWDGYSAGLLTYALTKYLWETTSKTKIQVALQQTANSVNIWSEKQQHPIVTGKIESDLTKNTPIQKPAVGFVADIDSKGSANLLITALPFVLLNAYKEESCFSVAGKKSTEQNLLQLRSREGISAKAQLLEKDKADLVETESLVNRPIQEAVRVLPHNIGLKVALDNHLERIERVDATSALANISTVKAAVTAGEGYADCLLGKISLMVEKEKKEPQAPENPSHSYGLYTPRGKLIPNTPGEVNEVVKTAVNRLESFFNRLLAAKWLELTVNENSSTIPILATLELASHKSVIQKKASLIANANTELNPNIPTIERGAEIILNIENKSDRDLYSIVIGVDSNKSFITLYTPQKSSNANTTPVLENLKISPQGKLVIPQAKNSWHWKMSQPIGVATMYLITAVKPFTNTLDLVAQQSTTKLDEPQIIDVSNSLEVAKAVLKDIHLSSDAMSKIASSNSDIYALDVNNWASLKFVYDVV